MLNQNDSNVNPHELTLSLDVTPPLYRKKAPNLLQKLPNFSKLKALALLKINEAVAYSDAIHFIITATSFIKDP